MKPIILASSSRYRRELLNRLAIPFEAIAPDIDESPAPDESPRDLVARLSLGKANAIATHHPSAIVIGSDQVAVRGDEVLGKPGSVALAVDQLLASAGRTLTFLTGLVVIDRAADVVLRHVDETHVRFRALDRAAIERYVALDQPLDCAGSIRSESRGSLLFEAIETSDPSAGIGLPLIKLGEMLRQVGVDPLAPTIDEASAT